MPVYFIQAGAGGAIKIGFARDVAARIRYLDVASPVPLVVLATVAGGCDIERRAHRCFQHLRIRGEWFRPEQELIEFCRAPNPDDLPAMSKRTLEACKGMRRSFSGFAGVINRWPNAEVFASDLRISGVRARQWRRRNSIPAEKWQDLIGAAKTRGIDGITSDLLTSIAAAGTQNANGEAA